ncbi:hypothetical protein TNIN_68771 [Trichonephila inaurata madagascariensis]|uniref:Uncharacterized protein n=1 Tax=Trichonephila inaurata madagascariensis TaxID=2747483 RepID=A0A8X7CKV4_9ARAC|nr:hypothetical protein TNIN_68771 [Trichonephila inaurata madagascariensis]
MGNSKECSEKNPYLNKFSTQLVLKDAMEQNRKGIDLDQSKDVQFLHPKGEGEPIAIVTEAKKHALQDYFCNEFQTYDMDRFNTNVEELCKFQGKFTPEDDEMNPNFLKYQVNLLKPTHLSVSEDEMNPDLKRRITIKLSQLKNIQYLPRKGDGEATTIITEAKKHDPQDYFFNEYQTYDTDQFIKDFEKFCSFQGKFTPEDDEMNPNFKALSESKLKPAHLSVSEDENNPNLKTSSE